MSNNATKMHDRVIREIMSSHLLLLWPLINWRWSAGLDLAEVVLGQDHSRVLDCGGWDGFIEVAEGLLIVQGHHFLLHLCCHLDGRGFACATSWRTKCDRKQEGWVRKCKNNFYKFVLVQGFRLKQNSDSDRNRILETVPLLWSLSRKDSSLSSLLSPSTLTLLLLDISAPRKTNVD